MKAPLSRSLDRFFQNLICNGSRGSQSLFPSPEARYSLATAAQLAEISIIFWMMYPLGGLFLRLRMRSYRASAALGQPASSCAAIRTCPAWCMQVGGVLVVNPGSIGMAAYTDDGAVPHAIETGTPHARYAVMTRELGNTWSVDLRAVVYSWHRAAQQAATNGRLAVARWTSTGRA